MNRHLVGFLVAATLVAACKEREPYPQTFPGLKQDVLAPSVATSLVPLVAVVTPEGSFIATARTDGSDLDVRRVQGLVYVRRDGSLARFEAKSEPQGRRSKGSPESLFTALVWRVDGHPGGQPAGASVERILFPLSDQKRPDLKRLAAADPDLASLYYHRETVRPFGVVGSYFSWIVQTEGFLGGAHPYTDARFLTVDAETGERTSLLPFFGERDLGAEAVQGVKPEECLRRFAGVAGAEGQGGEPIFAAMLAHEFEVCRGRIRLVRVAPADLQGPPSHPKGIRLEGGVLESEEGDLRVTGVADFRASPDGQVVVILASLGTKDRLPSPLAEGSERPRSREVRLWLKGGAAVILGRATRILTAQFLKDHPAAPAVIEAISGL